MVIAMPMRGTKSKLGLAYGNFIVFDVLSFPRSEAHESAALIECEMYAGITPAARIVLIMNLQ